MGGSKPGVAAEVGILHIPEMSGFRGETVAAWFQGFFTTILALSTLGASVTFSYVVGGLRDPIDRNPFNKAIIEAFLAISWLLFTLSLAFTTFFATILNFYSADAIKHWAEGGKRKVLIQWYATLTSALLYGLVVVAFAFLSLVVTAYTGTVGWIALAFTLFFGVVGFGAIGYQAPLWRTSRYK